MQDELEGSVFLGMLGETAAALMETGLFEEIEFQSYFHFRDDANRYELKFKISCFEVTIRQSNSWPAFSIRYKHIVLKEYIGKFHVEVADPNYTDKVVKIVQRLRNANVSALLHKAIKEIDE